MATREQIERNERLYREVNERINELSGQLLDDLHTPVDFFCECGRGLCAERIQLTLAEYETVRADPTYFAVLPHHEFEELEEIVARHARFVVVAKPWLAES